MEKVKYLSTAKIQNILTESLVNNRVKPINKIKKLVFEALNDKFDLDDGDKENVESLIDDIMLVFKNSQDNSNKISKLINLNKKHNLDLSKAPSLSKTLSMFNSTNSNGDVLREFIKTWLNYLSIDYKGKPVIDSLSKEFDTLYSEVNSKIGTNNLANGIEIDGGILSSLKTLIDSLNGGSDIKKANPEGSAKSESQAYFESTFKMEPIEVKTLCKDVVLTTLMHCLG